MQGKGRVTHRSGRSGCESKGEAKEWQSKEKYWKGEELARDGNDKNRNGREKDMTKEGIEKFIEQQEKIAQRNYDNYQSSGIARYDRAYRKAEDMVELGRQALSIADIKTQNGSMRSYMMVWGKQAVDILHRQQYEDQTEAIQQLLRSIKAVCVGMGACSDPWE